MTDNTVLDRITRATLQSKARSNVMPLVYRRINYQLGLALRPFAPVTVSSGPNGTSPEPPACIDTRTNRVYIDLDDLLAPQRQLEQGTISSRAATRTVAVCFHECGHARHTQNWVFEALHQLGLTESEMAAAQLLEEPRMEASLLRGTKQHRKLHSYLLEALPIAVVDVIIPVLLAAVLEQPEDRWSAGAVCSYVLGRVHAGTFDSDTWRRTLQPTVEKILGSNDLVALEQILQDVVLIGDGHPEELAQCAKRWVQIIGEPDANPTPKPTKGNALQEAVKEALQQSPAQTTTLSESSIKIAKALAQATQSTDIGVREAEGSTSSAGLPSGELPNLSLNRPPVPTERRFAQELAQQLRRAQTQSNRVLTKRTPGGRLDRRAAMRRHAQATLGMRTTSEQWVIAPPRRRTLREPEVLLIVDTSASMKASEGVLGSLCWIISEAIRAIGGRCATVAFGDGIGVIHNGQSPLRNVPLLTTNGGTAFGPEALALGGQCLRFDEPQYPRLVFVLSDGGWIDTAEGVHKIRNMRKGGVTFMHLSVGMPPLQHLECDQLIVIDSASEAMRMIASGVCDALNPVRKHRK